MLITSKKKKKKENNIHTKRNKKIKQTILIKVLLK